MQFYEESFPLKRKFPNFRPRERIDLSVLLEDHHPHMRHRQVQRFVLVIFGRVHFDAV